MHVVMFNSTVIPSQIQEHFAQVGGLHFKGHKRVSQAQEERLPFICSIFCLESCPILMHRESGSQYSSFGPEEFFNVRNNDRNPEFCKIHPVDVVMGALLMKMELQ